MATVFGQKQGTIKMGNGIIKLPLLQFDYDYSCKSRSGQTEILLLILPVDLSNYLLPIPALDV